MAQKCKLPLLILVLAQLASGTLAHHTFVNVLTFTGLLSIIKQCKQKRTIKSDLQ